jgi:4-hydroxythreonine-4-phosphate dehydrogenase
MIAKNPIVPRLALTLGEPAGIGPDICLLLAQKKLPAQIIVVGSADLLRERANRVGLPLQLEVFDPDAVRVPNGEGLLSIVDLPLAGTCIPGICDQINSPYVIATLKKAFALCAEKTCDALVTGPVNKAILHQEKAPFYGHTEFLAQCAGVSDVLMTFYTPEIILGLVTTHCPLAQVSGLLTAQRLEKSITLLQEGLARYFKKSHSKISICGVNPHAGEQGLLGNEEQAIMIPVIKALQQQGAQIEGPLPADTAFTPENRGRVDAILAMYHDQGLAPFKALFFNQIVNVTLGLPFLRTSVDHGTALSLAGTTQASPNSLEKAVHLAAQLCYES